MSRIILPENPDDVLVLMKKIIAKEEALGANSIFTKEQLLEFKDYFIKATEARTQQQDLRNRAEEQTTVYTNLLGSNAKTDQPGNAKFLYTSLRDMLAAKNKTNLKMLADWGFDVVDEAAPKKPKKA